MCSSNYIAINQHLQNTDWDMKFGDSDNVNTINEVINLELNSAMNTYIPKKIIRVRPRDKPWINYLIAYSAKIFPVTC
jgi:hypothetical protein